jgi:hypothetical protein
LTDTQRNPWGLETRDEEIDRLIERRAEQLAEQERLEQEQMEATLRGDLRAQATLRQEWAEHFRRMIGVHERMAEDNRRRLNQLIDEGA